MADGAAVLAGIARAPGVTYAALTPNLKGYEAARAAARLGGGDLRLGLGDLQPAQHQLPRSPRAWSDSRRSPRRRAPDGIAAARLRLLRHRLPLRGPDRPGGGGARSRARLFALGCREVSLGDTIGHGTPESVAAHAAGGARRRPAGPPRRRISTTRSAARSTTLRWRSTTGLRVFDASCGGLGGCPYAPGRGRQRRHRTGRGAAGRARLRDRARPRPAGRGRRFRPRRCGAAWSMSGNPPNARATRRRVAARANVKSIPQRRVGLW